jgi:hypothetical protein
MTGLDRNQIELMMEWFDEDLLKTIRVDRPMQIRFMFASLGRRLWPSALSGNPRGLCLGHVILIDQSVSEFDKILFHELVHTEQWRDEMASVLEYLESYGERLPQELRKQQAVIADALDAQLAKAS